MDEWRSKVSTWDADSKSNFSSSESGSTVYDLGFGGGPKLTASAPGTRVTKLTGADVATANILGDVPAGAGVPKLKADAAEGVAVPKPKADAAGAGAGGPLAGAGVVQELQN